MLNFKELINKKIETNGIGYEDCAGHCVRIHPKKRFKNSLLFSIYKDENSESETYGKKYAIEFNEGPQEDNQVIWLD